MRNETCKDFVVTEILSRVAFDASLKERQVERLNPILFLHNAVRDVSWKHGDLAIWDIAKIFNVFGVDGDGNRFKFCLDVFVQALVGLSSIDEAGISTLLWDDL